MKKFATFRFITCFSNKEKYSFFCNHVIFFIFLCFLWMNISKILWTYQLFFMGQWHVFSSDQPHKFQWTFCRTSELLSNMILNGCTFHEIVNLQNSSISYQIFKKVDIFLSARRALLCFRCWSAFSVLPLSRLCPDFVQPSFSSSPPPTGASFEQYQVP